MSRERDCIDANSISPQMRTNRTFVSYTHPLHTLEQHLLTSLLYAELVSVQFVLFLIVALMLTNTHSVQELAPPQTVIAVSLR